MFQDILFILVNYIEYNDLVNLSKIMKIPDYIWTISFTKTFGLQNIELKEFYNFLYDNSYSITKIKRETIGIIINNDKITNSILRLFSYSPLVFSTENNTIYELRENELIEINYSHLFEIFASYPKKIRFVFDFLLNVWNIEELKNFGINRVYKFAKKEITFMFKVKELFFGKKRSNYINTNMSDSDVSNMIRTKEILSGKEIRINNYCINLLFFNDYYIYYQINTTRSITETKLKLIARKNFFELLNLISDKIKIDLFNKNII